MVNAHWYEENILGYATDKTYITQYTIDYLYDNRFFDEKIISIMSTLKKESIKYDDLPSSLWSGLLKRNIYYFHPELQILSEPPKLTIGSDVTVHNVKFFKEMRIAYSKDDVLSYFYSNSRPHIIKDKKRDIGSLEYLLERYSSSVVILQPVDIILYLIDFYASEVSSLIDLTNYEAEGLERIESIYLDAHRSGTDSIKYRWKE